MFKKTIENVAILKNKHELNSKSLTLLQKIELANECLNEVKSKEEYLEIEKIYNELKSELRLEAKGFSPKEPLVTPEKAKEILEIANKEISTAETEYLKIKNKVDVIQKKYKKEIEVLLNAMKEIEINYSKALYIDQYLPIGYDSRDSIIKSSWAQTAHAAAFKYQKNSTQHLLAISTTNPKTGVIMR